MSLTPYEVAILRSVGAGYGGSSDINAVAVDVRLSPDTVRRRVRSLVRQGALIRHPRTGVLSLTMGGRVALDMAERGGAA